MRRQIQIKRAYDAPSRGDGKRVLVDRLWPRGLSKDAAAVDLWLKDAAPSDRLRRWFGHDPARWDAFRRRYAAELDEKPATALAPLRSGRVTLLFGARDAEHNNAVALAQWLSAQNSAS